jgi:hypothetical protein
MKILKVLPFLLVAALCIPAAAPSRVNRDSLSSAEKSLDDRLRRQGDLGLVGGTRGVYLEGYGAVFSAEVTLATVPASMFTSVTQKQMDQVKATKLQRLPELKNTIKQQLVAMASTLDIPSDEQVAIALLLVRYPGEEKTIPVQIVLQAPKRKLLEAQGAAALDQIVHVTDLY